MPVNRESNAPKNLSCDVCQMRFSRTDHLKRHQLRHTGVKPYACTFCNDGFTRSDNLREHYVTCLQRNDREIPEAGRGGRKSHACDICTSMKIGCDGNLPCQTCWAKKIECKFSKVQSKGRRSAKEETSITTEPENDVARERRGSIGFLLNAGTSSFIQGFQYPPSFNHTPSFGTPDENVEVDWSIFSNEACMKFMNADYPDLSVPVDDNLHTMYPFHYPPPDEMASVPLPAWESHKAPHMSIIEAILSQAMILNVTQQERMDLAQCLNYLFTPTKLVRLIGLFFDKWHPNCPIIHQPSFCIETAAIPLLLTMSFMGATYSNDERERSAAKVLLDLGEMYVFSLEEFRDEYDVRQMIQISCGLRQSEPRPGPCYSLQNLQAAYGIICLQNWAGNPAAKRRARDTRWGSMMKVVRRSGLIKSSHNADDSYEEVAWIEKECCIRLMNFIILLDCAFYFFSNYPPRLVISEFTPDLICQSYIFAAAHPFLTPNFRPSRNLNVYAAFRSLFWTESHPFDVQQADAVNPLQLNTLDMFLLIHILYVYTQTQMTLFSLPSSLPISPLPSTADSSGAIPFANNTNLTLIRGALDKWRTLWNHIRALAPSHNDLASELFKSCYNHWLVTKLLITNPGSVNIVMSAEVNCEDALERYRELIGVDGVNDGHV